MSTVELGTSTRVDSNSQLPHSLGWVILAIASISALCSIVLTVHSFVRCPFSDMWRPIDDIALGRKWWDLAWLWSQHNEHRIAVARLLVSLDWGAFGGYGISLLVFTYLCQFIQWGAIVYVLERWSSYSTSLKRVLQGLFALCLFHPLQAENLVLPFQVSFVLPFALATLTFLVTAFRDHARRQSLVVLTEVFAPAIAALNLAGGLLIWPAVLLLAYIKRLPSKFWMTVLGAFFIFSVVYLVGYQTPTRHSSPLETARQPFAVLSYVVAYIESPFHLLPLSPVFALTSLGYLFFVIARVVRNPQWLTDFERFCVAECWLVLATAVLTGLGRLNLGREFALISRYHTPVLIYWASLLSLVAVRLARNGYGRLIGCILLLPVGLWTCLIPVAWGQTAHLAQEHRRACHALLLNRLDGDAEQSLNPLDPGAVRVGADLLRQRWGAHLP